jgi:hypothetical protein
VLAAGRSDLYKNREKMKRQKDKKDEEPQQEEL